MHSKSSLPGSKSPISRKQFVIEHYSKIASERDRWITKNRYYYGYLSSVLKFNIEPESTVLQVKCETGYFLNAVRPRRGLGIDSIQEFVNQANNKYSNLVFKIEDPEEFKTEEKFEYALLINTMGEITDIYKLLVNLKLALLPQSRVIIFDYNRLWLPFIHLAEFFRLKVKQPIQNWLSQQDLVHFLHLSGYEVINISNVMLMPFYIPFVSYFLNNLVAKLPVVRHLCLHHIIIARPSFFSEAVACDYSVSVVVPCKNERNTIEDIASRIPEMGVGTEIIFCDDRSEDGTAEEIIRVQQKFTNRRIKFVRGPGKGKAENVWAGFASAEGDILMIFDADISIIPEELPYFYEAIKARRSEFVNGSRLVYPMQGKAMSLGKMFGNKCFSMIFSYILGHTIKDTLCGTKVFWHADYQRMKRYIGTWGIADAWGDYDLLFSAARLNLKIVDLPVHYFERTYGSSKMKNVFRQGYRLLRIALAGLYQLRISRVAE